MAHLVTGAAGFIGSHLADALAAEGERVVGLDDLSGGFADNAGVQLLVGDILEADLDAIFSFYGITHVWHLAAYAAEGLSHWVREHNVRNNWQASTRLIKTAAEHDIQRFFFTSSMAVYGTQPVPYTESQWPKPEDPYGIAKHAVEQDLKAAYDVFGLDYTIFRPHNVYGPRQNVGDPYRNVVGIFMRQALTGEPLTVFGDGTQTRAFSYITDIVDPMVEAWKRDKSGTFNIGGEQPITVGELAEKVVGLFGGTIRHTAERHEVKHAWCDHAHARLHLGFDPQVDFDAGLEKMAEWVRRVGIRRTPTPSLEMTRDLPEFWRV